MTRPSVHHRSVRTIQVGIKKYKDALDIQHNHARQHLDFLAGKQKSPGENVLLVVEHPAVYTVGLRDKQYSMEDEQKLRNLGADFHRTNRGGLITFHGPGQLVIYPILHLKNFSMGMRQYICGLEKSVISTCKYYGITAKTTDDTGVWVEDRKICALGVHASRFVTTHGLALNCTTDLKWFDHIVPCGIEGKSVTSLSAETGSTVEMKDALLIFVDAFKKIFDCDIIS